MIENHSKDRLVKEVLMMVLVVHTEEDDTVLHIEKIGMLMLVVEVDVGGMTADVVDKLTCSFDDVQPKQVGLRSAHALTKLHWHDTHVDPDKHEVDQRHMSKQCTKPKRRRDEQWFKDKVLLVQAQANGQFLQEEELEFLADPGMQRL
uniref:Retrovirus-related Pol polyprotein from transposon TNT 1-94 n=1 Tax=Tanacetum cinerariifolium TaxID=118510 RepID=A0A699QYV1_TANCI|nr:retrovirus-related Pol polyprotein from transposon TNT 1-94 [Tanacetum cinerariifolium]